MAEEVDVVVVGMGPGGEEVAGSLASAGLKVVGVEKKLLGGECPYWGCIPSKMMIRAADMVAEARRVTGFAGTATVAPDWAPVARRIRDEATDDWNDRVAVERFEGKGGIFVRGEGRLAGRGEVVVDDRRFRARRAVVIGTGTSPVVPPIPGLADVPYWTNRDAIEAATLPQSLMVLGGGAIGVELAQVFARFGVKVTILEAADRPLSIEEPESGALVAKVLSEDGIDLRTGTRVTAAGRDGDRITVTTEAGDSISAEKVLVATGRKANLGDLGLDTIGLDPGARFIPVDEHLRASPGVWAVGDVTGKGLFTHIAIYQARIATADILGRDGYPADYHALPRVTFTDPEIGATGLTEAQARERNLDVRTGITPITSSTRGWIHGPGSQGFIKLVEDRARGVLVGATTAGPPGGELLSMLALAVQEEIPTRSLRQMIYAYPTFHRGIEGALADLAAN